VSVEQLPAALDIFCNTADCSPPTAFSVRFGSVRFSSVQFSSVQFSSVQFSSVQFSSVRLQATRGILISTARVNLNKFLILIIKPTRCTYFSNLFLEKTLHVSGQLLCPSSGVFHCTHSNGICHTGLLKACTQD